MSNILLVEDDKPLALGVVYSLKKEGFTVFHGDSISSARELFRENDIDLILLDVMLPDGTGYDFCEEIRKGDMETPIIFMTACDDESNVVLGLDLGGDDYIGKPVRIKELTSRMNAVLRRRGKALKDKDETGVIISGDIKVEPLKYNVSKLGESLNLTLSEYKLLILFMENYPNVLERNLILEKLWDIEGNFIDGSSLNVYIKRLREKIEDDIKNPSYIETIRAVGYRWCKEVNKK